MNRVYGVLLASMLTASPALAQFTPPPVLNPIPAPLAPPTPPAIINGPLGQSPPPGVYYPALRTHSDRTIPTVSAAASSRPIRDPARTLIKVGAP